MTVTLFSRQYTCPRILLVKMKQLKFVCLRKQSRMKLNKLKSYRSQFQQRHRRTETLSTEREKQLLSHRPLRQVSVTEADSKEKDFKTLLASSKHHHSHETHTHTWWLDAIYMCTARESRIRLTVFYLSSAHPNKQRSQVPINPFRERAKEMQMKQFKSILFIMVQIWPQVYETLSMAI